jgi:hypothetical protein
MADLGSLADQGTPLFTSLSQAASGINSQYRFLPAFARATRTSLINLGHSAAVQQPALISTIPLDRRLENLGKATLPAASQLDKLLESFQTTGGIQQLMALLLNGTGATNGFDSVGHYIRTESLFGSCTSYAKTPFPGCSANFAAGGAASAAQASLAHQAPAIRSVVHGVHPSHTTPSTGDFSHLLNYLIGGRR